MNEILSLVRSRVNELGELHMTKTQTDIFITWLMSAVNSLRDSESAIKLMREMIDKQNKHFYKETTQEEV